LGRGLARFSPDYA